MIEKNPIETRASCPEETLQDVKPGDPAIQSLTPEEDKRILRRVDM
jgi:hypothetical protein